VVARSTVEGTVVGLRAEGPVSRIDVGSSMLAHNQTLYQEISGGLVTLAASNQLFANP
jgi:hypothetical protein